MANYGDVALNLGPSWDRSTIVQKVHALWTVGHRDGIADAFLTKDPESRHQFAWIDPRNVDELASLRSDGYRFVKQPDGWEINKDLWDWDGEFFCVHKGQRLMARSSELYFAAKRAADEQRQRQQQSADEREADRIARSHNIEVYKDDKPARRARV